MTERVPCWACGIPRPIYETCLHCGASCKPLKAKKQRKRGTHTYYGVTA